MTTTHLETYFLIDQGAPAPERLVLDNVAMPPTVPAPDVGLTAHFGATDSIMVIRDRMKRAEQQGKVLIPVSIAIDIGRAVPGTLRPSDLQSTRLLNLNRINETIKDEYLRVEHEMVTQGGLGGRSQDRPFDNGLFITKRPDIVARAVLQSQMFSNISVVVYHVRNEQGDIELYATLVRPAGIKSVKAMASIDTRIVLPKRIKEDAVEADTALKSQELRLASVSKMVGLS